jgi:hypothetical protein
MRAAARCRVERHQQRERGDDQNGVFHMLIVRLT